MYIGGGSIKRSGLYDKIRELLKDFEVSELPGIEPNPKLTSVEKGTAICKEKGIQVILAVGGGSTIDTSKHIAASACYDGQPWDLVKDRSLVAGALPVAVVLTICATGSEMNSGAVIILSYVMEQYFQPNDEAYITDVLSEAVMKTVVKYARKAMDEPENYEARSNLMWASTIGLNHLLTVGKGGAWSVHPIEHVLSAYYDITHGVGLAILTLVWMEYVLSDKTAPRFARFAREVFGVGEADDRKAARLGIEKVRQFNRSLAMPSTLSEAGVLEEKFDEMAAEAVRTSGIVSRAYVKLQVPDVKNILMNCK
ncbi:iron-containing alcohol dehydrogenase [Blautia sp. 1033sp1_1033st1_G9_1033SCRN_220408]|uniref:iron-containing alcohol dehydrogenase n=1 Tax=Blautia sp. 1033sp1_1033st1_G9_1033SCRN_220408 TaxID=3144490 RepID=UPI0034A4F5BD